MTRPCPSCHVGDGLPRTGTLGEFLAPGLWCPKCGHTWDTPSVAADVGATAPPHYIHQINAVSGDDLDYAASKFFGITRKMLGPWQLENDEEFRARIRGDAQ